MKIVVVANLVCLPVSILSKYVTKMVKISKYCTFTEVGTRCGSDEFSDATRNQPQRVQR